MLSRRNAAELAEFGRENADLEDFACMERIGESLKELATLARQIKYVQREHGQSAGRSSLLPLPEHVIQSVQKYMNDKLIDIDIFCRLSPPCREYLNDVWIEGDRKIGVIPINEDLIPVLWHVHKELEEREDHDARICGETAREVEALVRRGHR